MEPIKKEMWKCPICNELFDSDREADICTYKHLKERCINHDLNAGYNLDYLNSVYALGWELTDKQKEIDKDSCFIIPHLQGCGRPAYKIFKISCEGVITVSGRGSWSGYYYSSIVRLGDLLDPRPKEELFTDLHEI
ncbi:MAG: hypothetical protein SVO01_12295 [Thermotogota bacterium]|nr:hypothetical protein [Thermotogota bacterium]